jgi:protein TonB
VGLVIWLGWRGGDETDGKAHAASPAYAATTVTARPLQTRLPDNDPVWKPNPGGEMLVPVGKPSPGSPVKFASKVDVIENKKATSNRSLLSADAANVALPRRSPDAERISDPSPSRATAVEQPSALEAPPIPAELTSSSPPSSVLVAKATVPTFAVPVSQGVSGGQLIHRVSPVYPAQARMQRLEGRVVVEALVKVDGTISDLKVVQGHPTLSQATMEAVKQWRYQPFILNGRPIARPTTITIDFKLP